MVAAQLPTPTVGGVPRLKIQMRLSMNYTPEYLRGRGPDDRFRKYVPVTNSMREKE